MCFYTTSPNTEKKKRSMCALGTNAWEGFQGVLDVVTSGPHLILFVCFQSYWLELISQHITSNPSIIPRITGKKAK